MLTNNYKTVLFLVVFFAISIQSASFEEIWFDMQNKYQTLTQQIDKNYSDKKKSELYHPYWEKTRNLIKKIIEGKPDIEWWNHAAITSTMFRDPTMGYMQNFELTYLKHCVSQETLSKLKLIKESDCIAAPKACQEFNCTTNTLGHLYYLAQISQLAQQKNILAEKIIEVGAGFGNLARLCKFFWPEASIILIDLPELLALQYLFLKQNFPDASIIMHEENPSKFKKGTFHLVPIHFFEELQCNTDFFISTFALSETPDLIQKIACQKKFFNAQLCYIVGQLEGWNNLFVDSKIIIKTIQDNYHVALCTPFHMPLESNVNSYEMIAFEPKE